MGKPRVRVPVVDFPGIEGLVGIISKIEYVYEGTGNNKVLKQKRFYNGPDLIFVVNYTYDAQNDLTKKERANG